MFLKAETLTAHAPCHVSCGYGVQNDLNSRGHIVYSLYNFYGPTMTIYGRL